MRTTRPGHLVLVRDRCGIGVVAGAELVRDACRRAELRRRWPQ